MTQELQNSKNNICKFPLHGNRCNILEGSSIATFAIDTQHKIILWNQACEVVTGYKSTEMLGTNRQWSPFYPSPRLIMADLILNAASSEDINQYYGDCWRASKIIPNAFEADGYFPRIGVEGSWIFFTASPLLDENSNIIGAIETLQDITLRKVAEESLKIHQENLEKTVLERTSELTLAHLELTAKAATLQETNEELSQYAFVVSHDLRAPLRAVRNYADFLREELEGVLNDEQRSYFDGMTSALKFGDELVSDLLDFSRVGGEIISIHKINLDAFFAELKEEITIPIDSMLICATDLPAVMGDKTLLRQMFTNLITNGFKFNKKAHKKVEIGLSQIIDEKCDIYIRDNGIGIDPRYHERIFKMFKRLHTQKEFEGTGIGLAIVKKVAVKLGGSVRIESEVGVGSTFFVTLPLG